MQQATNLTDVVTAWLLKFELPDDESVLLEPPRAFTYTNVN